jgi:5'-3' exonuclease
MRLKGKQKEKLIDERDNAFLSAELVTIKTEVEFLDDARRLPHASFDPTTARRYLRANSSSETLIEEFAPTKTPTPKIAITPYSSPLDEQSSRPSTKCAPRARVRG